MKKVFSLVLTLWIFSFAQLAAQPVIDEVVAVVGNEYVLMSEIEVQMLQFKDAPETPENLRCWILDQMMQKKLLLSRAKTDSLKVTDEQVEGELNRRIEYFVGQIGSVAALEDYYDKTIDEIKADFRSAVKEQLMIDMQQQKIVGNVDVTPQDIKDFYYKVPEDSLPYYSSELEIGQLVIFPQVTKEDKQAVIKQLREIRAQVLAGKSFKNMAILYSEDKGTAVNGGCMELTRADNFVPEFAAAALRLKKDSISDVVETKYGFHIIKLLNRRGDMVEVCHILIKPKFRNEVLTAAKTKLDSIRFEIMKDTLTFEAAAYKYSQDEETKNRGGLLIDPKTSSSKIPVEELDKTIFFAVDKLKPGEVSDPVYFVTMDGRPAYRMFYLKSRTLPHKANLKDDYPKIKQIVTEYSKAVKLDDWIKKTIPKVYVRIEDGYNCPGLQHWQKGQRFMLSGVKQ